MNDCVWQGEKARVCSCIGLPASKARGSDAYLTPMAPWTAPRHELEAYLQHEGPAWGLAPAGWRVKSQTIYKKLKRGESSSCRTGATAVRACSVDGGAAAERAKFARTAHLLQSGRLQPSCLVLSRHPPFAGPPSVQQHPTRTHNSQYRQA